MKATIKTKEPVNAITMGIAFIAGVAETDDPWLIQRFKEKGYEVEITEAKKTNTRTKVATDTDKEGA